MVLSSKKVATVLFTLSVGLLTSCGTAHDKSADVSISGTLPDSIQSRISTTTSTVPPTTTTTTVDPGVYEFLKAHHDWNRLQEALRKQRQRPKTYSNPHTGHSDAWWRGVSVCEQGGRNDSFFGYFSIMDGSAGGLDWATQVNMANAIIARAGDHAWAASCVAAGYRSSPNG